MRNLGGLVSFGRLNDVMDANLPPSLPVDKTWTRQDVLREARNLYETAPESAVRLRCLELILEILPPEAPKQNTPQELLASARKKIHGAD